MSQSKMKGSDNQEKLVYQVIEDAGNKGRNFRGVLSRQPLAPVPLGSLLG